jgi:putative DNA primase/helicase
MGSARFDAEKLKSASSGDPMRPSRKGEKSFEMRPECAIWMATNDLPRVPTHDPALWDRLRFVEFTRQFALSAYGDELAEDPDVLAAVLAWAVEGAVEFNKNGLPECDKVAKAIDKARGELDPLAEWFEERVDHKRLNAPEVFTAVASLYCDYVVQALASGERPVSKSEFGRLLAQRRVADARNDDVRGWRLKLRTPPRSRP